MGHLQSQLQNPFHHHRWMEPNPGAATLLECERIAKLANYKLQVLQLHKPDRSSEAKDVFHV